MVAGSSFISLISGWWIETQTPTPDSELKLEACVAGVSGGSWTVGMPEICQLYAYQTAILLLERDLLVVSVMFISCACFGQKGQVKCPDLHMFSV